LLIWNVILTLVAGYLLYSHFISVTKTKPKVIRKLIYRINKRPFESLFK